MKKVAMLSCAVIFECLSSSGQTNCPPAPTLALSLPPVQLRSLLPEPESPSPAPVGLPVEGLQLAPPVSKPDPILVLSTNTIPAAPSDHMTLASGDFNLALYRRLEEGGYLTRPERPSDNLLVRSFDAVFTPEVFKVGKTSVSCSLLTAVKRKNPFCLLNPIVLNVSW